MAVQVNKRNLRFIALLLLAFLAVLLVLRNLHQVKLLATSQTTERIPRYELKDKLESLSLRQLHEALPLVLSTTEEPRFISPRTRELQQLLKCRNRELRLKKFQHGEYWVVENLVIGTESQRMGCTESITYTTNGDFTFFDNLETVAER